MSEQVIASVRAVPGAATGAEDHAEPAAAESSYDDNPRRGRLPSRQPLRAIVVCLAYVLLVASSLLVLSQLYRTSLAIFFTTGFAALLTVPVSVLAPSPCAASARRHDARPVLQRVSRAAEP